MFPESFKYAVVRVHRMTGQATTWSRMNDERLAIEMVTQQSGYLPEYVWLVVGLEFDNV